MTCDVLLTKIVSVRRETSSLCDAGEQPDCRRCKEGGLPWCRVGNRGALCLKSDAFGTRHWPEYLDLFLSRSYSLRMWLCIVSCPVHILIFPLPSYCGFNLYICKYCKSRPLLMKIHQLRSADSKNPPTANCLIQKPTNCSVKIAVREFLGKALRSWWIFRKSTSQLVDFYWEGSKWCLFWNVIQ